MINTFTDYRLTLAAFALASFYVWGILGVLLGPVLPEIRGTLEITASQGGAIFVAWSSGFVGGSMMAGRLVIWFGIIRTLAWTLLLAAAATAGVAVAPSYVVLLALYGGAGLFGGAVFTASHTLFGQMFVERRSAALSTLDLAFSIGNVSAPLLVVSLFLFGADWRLAYLVIAVGLFIVGLFFVALGRKGASATPNPDQHAEASNDAKAGRGKGLLDALMSGPGLVLALSAFALGAVEWTQHVWFVSYGMAIGMDDQMARLAMAFFVGGMIAIRMAAVALGRRANTAPVVLGIGTLAVVGAVILPLAQQPGQLMLGGLLLGLGVGAYFPVLLGTAMDAEPRQAAAFSALMIISLTVGGQVAALATGVLSDMIGMTDAYRLVIPLTAGLLVLSASAFCLRLARTEVPLSR